MRGKLIGMPADKIVGESETTYHARKAAKALKNNDAVRSLRVGDRIKFKEERLSYEIMARGERYLVCTKPFNPRRTVLYTIVDLDEWVRGTENLIFGAGAETVEQCSEMLTRLEGRDEELGFKTEVSHRNRCPLNIDRAIFVKRDPA